jgi:hypothetical protein
MPGRKQTADPSNHIVPTVGDQHGAACSDSAQRFGSVESRSYSADGHVQIRCSGCEAKVIASGSGVWRGSPLIARISIQVVARLNIRLALGSVMGCCRAMSS